ncbi:MULTISPECIES: GNAT family N-acetyltransferase [unclassified Arthrobacter]|uniref:GNAT family N-acetyltransferase n=1 Tax=unclassified Arthrobacter TaxID=235627 RepID=UPI0033960993
MSQSPEITLADVHETLLGPLLVLAMSDAAADEVTPPLGSVPGWNSERLNWFRAYHRAASSGLRGPAGEKSWVVLCDGSPAGSVRLKLTADNRTAETGIWLAHSFRRCGIGTAAMALVLAAARRAGLRAVTAQTTAGNSAAQRLLRAAGAVLTHDGDGGVSAVVVLSADFQ